MKVGRGGKGTQGNTTNETGKTKYGGKEVGRQIKKGEWKILKKCN